MDDQERASVEMVARMLRMARLPSLLLLQGFLILL